MKTTIYKNIDLVQINLVAGVADYYLPKNVAWTGRKVEQFIMCTPETACTSPIDGVTPVVTRQDIQDCYLSLYAQDGSEIVHDLSYEQVLHTNNQRVRIDKVLNLELCRVRFTTPPTQAGALLLYAVYGSKEVEDYEIPGNSVSTQFVLYAGSEISFRDIINKYIHALPRKVKSITFYDAKQNPAFVQLRDFTRKDYELTNLYCEMARPQVFESLVKTAEDVQAATLYLDDMDIDFDYSRIYNPTASDNIQTIEFGY